MSRAVVTGKGLQPWLDTLAKFKGKRVVVGLLGSGASAVHPPSVAAHKDETAKAHGKRKKEAAALYAGSVSNVDVGTWMEFGTENAAGKTVVPERSFLRATMKSKGPTLRAFVESRARRVMAGKATVETAYEEIGLKTVALVQGTIRAGIAPDLKVREGVPLINTSQLLKSITSETRSK